MKEFNTSMIISMPLPSAFELVFNSKELSAFMNSKNNYEASEWKNNKRKVQFEMQNCSIPQAILHFIGGGKIRVTAIQEKEEKQNGCIKVRNKLRPHVLGAEFIRIKPALTLTSIGANQTELNINCKTFAIMPPPLNGIFEDFMCNAAKANYEWFTSALSTIEKSCPIRQ